MIFRLTQKLGTQIKSDILRTLPLDPADPQVHGLLAGKGRGHIMVSGLTRLDADPIRRRKRIR